VRADDERDLQGLADRVRDRARFLPELDALPFQLCGRGVEVREREAEVIDRAAIGWSERQLVVRGTCREHPHLAVEQPIQAREFPFRELAPEYVVVPLQRLGRIRS